MIAGYGSGHIRIFSIAEACIVAEAAAHAGLKNNLFLEKNIRKKVFFNMVHINDISQTDFSSIDANP